MNELRVDPPRSSRVSPQPDAIRWFKIYTTWSDLYPTQSGATSSAETTAHDQRCTAKHTVRHPTRSNQWVATEPPIFEFLYDPSRSAKPAINALVKAHYNPINQHWEVIPAAPGRGWVQFTMSGVLSGFNTAGALVRLDNSNLNGWLGATEKFGSEDAAGIEYVNGETAPQTNGIYKATKNGVWLINVMLREVQLLSTETNPPSGGTENTGAASAGTAHTHLVTKPGMIGPRFFHRCWKKPVVGAIASSGHYAIKSFPYIATSGNTWEFSFQYQFALALLENEKVSFEWSMSGSDRTAYTFDFTTCTSYVSFDYLDDYVGSSLGFRSVAADP